MQIVRDYLYSRAIPLNHWPEDMRYHPRVSNHTTGKRHPAMVCAVRDFGGEVTALHITYLTPDGHKISGEGVKPKLFMGSVKGGAIRLAKATDRLALAEGVETALSVAKLTGWPCWAVGSASNIPDLPEGIGEVLLAADSDVAGARWAYKAAEQYTREGRAAKIITPPDGAKDFNDYLAAGGEYADTTS